MKLAAVLVVAVGMISGAFLHPSPASKPANQAAGTRNEIQVPPRYRDWKFISVAHEAGGLNDIRATLGNEIAVKAYRDGTRPFPDGAIIARLAWNYQPSAENNRAFGQEQSFVAGSPTNVQFITKSSKEFATTGGWGFAQVSNGKSINEAVPANCFSCHQSAKARDFVFTRYAP